MKKLFGILALILVVGFVFVGCSNKEEDTYYYDVYDTWNALVLDGEKVGEDEFVNKEFYNSDIVMTYDSPNISYLTAGGREFADLSSEYNVVFRNLNKNITELSYLFVHMPELEGKQLRNAKKAVEEYKDQLEEYRGAISTFQSAKQTFITTCEQMEKIGEVPVVGVIENSAYKTFKSAYVGLINAAYQNYSKMMDCANIMYLTYRDDVAIENNSQRIDAVRTYYYGAKFGLNGEFIKFKYNIEDQRTERPEISVLQEMARKINATTLTEVDTLKVESELNINLIDAKIKSIATIYKFFGNEKSFIQSSIENEKFDFDVSDLTDETAENQHIKAVNDLYKKYANTTCPALINTVCEMVELYK